MTYYFAYGSNMDEKRMKERMETINGRCGEFPKSKFRIIGGGIKKGYILKFNKEANGKTGEGYANIAKDPTGRSLIFMMN